MGMYDAEDLRMKALMSGAIYDDDERKNKMRVEEVLDKRNKLQNRLVSLTNIKQSIKALYRITEDKDEINNFESIESKVDALIQLYQDEFNKLGNMNVAM
jgi:hypothetical protein